MTSATEKLRRLLDGLRGVGNLHEFAELFGFDWNDDSDWCWHDVAVKMADDLEQAVAATPGIDGTRWHELFGTPERAARTLEKGKTLCAWCDKQTCSTSGGECQIFDYDALLEWLRGDAE